MKPIQTISILEQSGVTEKRQFSMQASKKMYQILSGLYSDTILAIVRELSTNCLDSHVAAGKRDVPFHIHLPNSLEPFLNIQDFGTGISHQNIYDIYTVYGASTKEDSNDFVGMLGLGSKTPMAYTDNFLVTSIVDGEKRIYSVYFSEQGTPSIALMSTEATREHNGLAIQIPVKEDDFYKFRDATEKALRFFDVKPTVSGGTVNWTKDVCTFEGTGWKSFSSFSFGESYAVMGNISYPIDYDKVNYELRDLAHRGGLVIDFGMGELDFTPSREALEYGEVTVNALNNRLEFIAKDFVDKIADTIKDKVNLYDALKAVSVVKKNFHFLDSRIKKDAFVWQGQDISNPYAFVKKLIYCDSTYADYKHYYYESYRRKKVRSGSELNFDETWYYNDMKRGGENRVKRFVKNNVKACMYFDETAYNRLVAAGIPATAFVACSTLPKIERVSNGGTGIPMDIKVFKLSGDWRKPLKSEVFDPNYAPKYYIVKDAGAGNSMSFRISHAKMNGAIYDKDTLERWMEYGKIKNDDVVLVSARNEKHLIAAGSEPFADYVSNLLDNGITIPSDEDLAISRKYSDSNNYYTNIKAFNNYKDLSDTNPLKLHVERVLEASANVKSVKCILHYLITSKTVNAETVKVDCPATKLLIQRIGTWQNEDIVTLAKVLDEKKLKINLAIKQEID